MFSRFARSIVTASVVVAYVHANENATDAADMELPDVDAVLSEASDTVQQFLSSANSMQSLANAKHEESGAALAATKEKFEWKLNAQAENNTHVKKLTEDLQLQAHALRKGNQLLKANAKKLKKRNHILRESMWILSPRIRTAADFLDDTLKIAENSKQNATALQVLEAPLPEPTLDHFLHVMRDEAPTEAQTERMSLLQTSNRKKRKDKQPEELIDDLSKSLENLELAQQEGKDHLQANFLAHMEKEQKEYSHLMAEQEKVKEELEYQQAHQQDLHNAKARLSGTGDDLDKRLEGVRTFVHQVIGDVQATISRAKAVSAQASK